MSFILILLLNIVRIYKYAILARVLISWMSNNRQNRIVVFVYQLTEPVLRIFRSILPRTGMIDLSPLIAFIALDFAALGIAKIMIDLGI